MTRRLLPVLVLLLLVLPGIEARAAGPRKAPAPASGHGGTGLHWKYAPRAREFRIRAVPRGTPAHGAGLRRGDVIVTVDGRKVSERHPVSLRGPVGAPVKITVVRAGARRTFDVTRALIPSP